MSHFYICLLFSSLDVMAGILEKGGRRNADVIDNSGDWFSSDYHGSSTYSSMVNTTNAIHG